MTTIYLVRHGHYDSPSPVAPYRLPGFHLSALGKTQVTALAGVLSEVKLSAIFTSPMERTQETAAMIGKPHNIHPIADTRLLEVRSPLQGKTLAEIEELGGWNWQIYDTPWYASQKGETVKEIQARMISCIEEKRKEYKNSGVVLVSHGDPIMLAAAYYRGITPTVENMTAIQPYVAMATGFRIVFEAKSIEGIYPIVAS
jgi:broad specificity phosphatase PhoE